MLRLGLARRLARARSAWKQAKKERENASRSGVVLRLGHAMRMARERRRKREREEWARAEFERMFDLMHRWSL